MSNLNEKQRTAIGLFTCWWAMLEAEAEVTEQPFNPESVALSYMGCGASTMVMVKHLRDVCDVLNALATPPVASGALPELPEPLEINWPTLNSNALGCGVEDRGLHDRYECAEYGWQDGVDMAASCVPDAIYDADQMRAYGDARAAAAAPNAALVEALKMMLNCEGSFGKRVEAVNKARAALAQAGAA